MDRGSPDRPERPERPQTNLLERRRKVWESDYRPRWKTLGGVLGPLLPVSMRLEAGWEFTFGLLEGSGRFRST